jgi:hypothetical protein
MQQSAAALDALAAGSHDSPSVLAFAKAFKQLGRETQRACHFPLR